MGNERRDRGAGGLCHAKRAKMAYQHRSRIPVLPLAGLGALCAPGVRRAGHHAKYAKIAKRAYQHRSRIPVLPLAGLGALCGLGVYPPVALQIRSRGMALASFVDGLGPSHADAMVFPSVYVFEDSIRTVDIGM